MRSLSKSRLLAFRQCPKRLWLEINQPEVRVDSANTAASFVIGNTVGEVARRLYDPEGLGQLVNVESLGIEGALERSRELLNSGQPVFEAGFAAAGAMAFADLLLAVDKGGGQAWRMVEVKSATSLKDYYHDDAAIQAFVFRSAGVPLERVAVAVVDKTWRYPGQQDYRGLLREEDLTQETLGREEEVRSWIAEAHAVLKQRSEPARATGAHCSDPFECGFLTYCRSREQPVEYPVMWLPNVRTKALKTLIREQRITDLTQVPDELLNPVQQRVKAHTVSGDIYFDPVRAASDLVKHPLPAFFLDFEAIALAVPIWPGTRPYQPVPFQFSVHRISATGKVTHREFLDLSGADPRESLAEGLIAACKKRGPIFVFSAYEAERLRDLARQFPGLAGPLKALTKRLVDLRPIVERCYYHPGQQGSWSIKRVLPAMTDLDYDALEGVKDGGMAMEAYMEAISPGTSAERKREIEKELKEYCALDTIAMIRIWEVLAGRSGLVGQR